MGNKTPPVTDEVRNALGKIKDHRIFFGHQSVGYNIIDGLKSIAEESGISLTIEKIGEKPLTTGSKFVHFNPGQNTNPKSKIDGFVDQMKAIGNEYAPEIAFLKLCYIDFPPEADVKGIMDYYKERIKILKKENSGTMFIHVTSPLTVYPKDIKNKAKRMLGLQVWGDASNEARCKYNELLYKTFSKDLIFDIARIESTHADGSRETFTVQGSQYYCMLPAYTKDGGHLNTLGKRIVASELATFLARIIDKNNTPITTNIK